MKFQLNDALNILAKTPNIMQELLLNLDEPWVYNNEGPGTWSPYDIIGHLIHGENTDWIPRLKIILSNTSNKHFTPFDRYAQNELSKGKKLEDLLLEFKKVRQNSLAFFKTNKLTSEDYVKTGIHPEFGQVTISQLLSTWVAHDLSHINQMTRVMARNYKKEVGPWKNYISILK